jgi:hypothetical protein
MSTRFGTGAVWLGCVEDIFCVFGEALCLLATSVELTLENNGSSIWLKLIVADASLSGISSPGNLNFC